MTDARTDPADRPSGDDLRELARRLHSTAVHLLRHVRVEDREAGLTPARLSALSVLVFRGPCTVGELAEAEQVKPPTMSRLASALVDKGLVGRDPHPEDGRAVVLHATPEGRRLLEAGRDRRVERLRELLEGLEVDEFEAARITCTAVEHALSSRGRAPDEEGAGAGG